MSIENLAKQGKETSHSGLAGIDTVKLQKLRNEQLKKCFTHFDEQKHRMEYVARVRGMEFYNDAASRSVNATWYALESMGGNLLWIVNGDDNSTNYTKLIPMVQRKVKMIICVGKDTQNIHKAFDHCVDKVADTKTLSEAVHLAYCSNLENTKVLFSPAGENGVSYYEEGERFKMEVNEL